MCVCVLVILEYCTSVCVCVQLISSNIPKAQRLRKAVRDDVLATVYVCELPTL